MKAEIVHLAGVAARCSGTSWWFGRVRASSSCSAVSAAGLAGLAAAVLASSRSLGDGWVDVGWRGMLMVWLVMWLNVLLMVKI
jgi:hypothetical protein